MRRTSSSCTAALALLLAALPGRATSAPALAETFPAGARAYVELRDPAGAVDALLASPAARRLRRHPTAEAFWTSPRGLQLALAEAVLQGATGKGFRSLLRTIGSDEIALGLYRASSAPADAPPRVLVALRADPGALERVLASAERFFQRERVEIAAARGARSSLWTYGEKTPVFVFNEGSLWVFASDRALAEAAHAGPAPSMLADKRLDAARSALPRRGLLLGVLDAEVLPERLRLAPRPGHALTALLLGATSEQAARAPWLGVAGELSGADPRTDLVLALRIPTPQPASRAVARAYGGTLDPLPFRVGGSLALLRLHRNLASFFAQRDALVARPGIPALVELAQRLGPLSGNLDLVEEFLPGLHSDASLALLGPASPAPAGAGDFRLPDFALLLRMRQPSRLAPEAARGFQRLIEVENTQRRQRREPPWVVERAVHAGAPLLIARSSVPAAAADPDGAPAPVPSFPPEPTQTVAGEYLILASTARAARALLDARSEPTHTPESSNVQLEIDGASAAALLRANRAALVAHAAGGSDTERSIDFWLELAGFLEHATLVQREAKRALQVELELVLGPAHP